MIVRLLTENHLEFLSLKGDWTGSSESTLVKMPHCWKSHVAAQMLISGLPANEGNMLLIQLQCLTGCHGHHAMSCNPNRVFLFLDNICLPFSGPTEQLPIH